MLTSGSAEGFVDGLKVQSFAPLQLVGAQPLLENLLMYETQALTARGAMTKDVWVRVILPLAVGLAPPRTMGNGDIDRHVRAYTGSVEERWNFDP